MSEGQALLLLSKEYSVCCNKPNTFSRKFKKSIDFLTLVSIIRTNVRNKKSNREVNENMSAHVEYRLQNPRKLFRAVTIIALATSFSVAGISGSLATNGSSAELEYLTVNSGESLWELAAIHAPGEDPRDWIAEVVTMNALSTVDLQPGQRIAVPR